MQTGGTEQMREEEVNLSHAYSQYGTNDGSGRLKIFFGYAAGVGKTYAMLEAAHQAKREGIDVVVGYVEPHARPDTLALLNGLERLPDMDQAARIQPRRGSGEASAAAPGR